MPNNKYGIAVVVFFSIKFTIDTIKKHIEASKKNIHLILSFSTSVKFRFFITDQLFCDFCTFISF